MSGPEPTPVALDSDGGFLVGFDRDADVRAELVATLVDGRTETRPLSVVPRAWAVERVDAPLRAGHSDAGFDALRPAELARIAAARARNTGAEGWRGPFRWPLTGRISGRFGSQRVYQGVPASFHSGVDVARAQGTPVVAPADGVVVLAADPARPFTLEGNLLMIDHGHGLNSAFLHLSRIDVAEGQAVRAGQVLGAVGRTGRATGPHLHWSMKWGPARLDPEPIVGAMPAVE